MTDNLSYRQLGSLYEQFACEVLKKSGWHIMERGFTTRHGEIDIIAKKKNIISFIEVKARREGSVFTPQKAVDMRKGAKIIRSSASYLILLNEMGINLDCFDFDFSIFTVTFDKNKNVTEYKLYNNYFTVDRDDLLRFALRYSNGNV